MEKDPCAVQQNELFDALDAYNRIAILVGKTRARKETDTGLNEDFAAVEDRYKKAAIALASCRGSYPSRLN